MEGETKYLLEDLIFDLTEIPVSDILANVDFSKKDIFSFESEIEKIENELIFPIDSKWNRILKTTIQNKRQSDTNTLCLAIDGFEWEYKGKTIVSPLYLISANYKINKVKQEIILNLDFDNAIFNPFVKNELKRRYNLIWEESETKDFSQKSIEFYQFLETNEFKFKSSQFLVFGNFHHHRFQIVKDLEALVKSDINLLVQEMLGNPVFPEIEHLELTKQNIISSDKDQKVVFEKIEVGNTVIQGPPGTGKSQVLTNLLAKLLEKDGMNLVVSEKKVALEVLVKKLKVHGLDAFTFVAHNQSKPSDFISKLRETWSLLETKFEKPATNLLLSDQHLSHLQLTLDKLVSKNLIGGIGLYDFKKLIADLDLSEIVYTSGVPTVSVWLNEKEKLNALATKIHSFQILKNFSQKGLNEAVKIDQILAQLKSKFIDFTTILAFNTFGELEKRIKQIARCQILQNESYKKYATLFSNKKESKKFKKLRLTFLQQQEIFALVSNEIQHWKEKATLSQVQSWKIQLSGSWWKKRKAEKQIQRSLTNVAILPTVAIENWIHYLETENQLQHTIAQLIELGIERPPIELESIYYLLNQLENEDANELKEINLLSNELKSNLINFGTELQQSFRELKNILNFSQDDEVIQVIKNAEKNLPEILLIQQTLQEIPGDIYRLLQQNDTVDDIEKIVLKGNWVQFQSHFPELAKFDGLELKSRIEKITTLEKEENELFSKALIHKQHQQFKGFHELLRKPSAKLLLEEKALKSRVKTGKSILVKEFGKSKQHKTIRELLDSDARLWIEILTPIWLSTPQKVASSFPMEKDLFECVIFDEASQIPLSNALGSLQRAKRAIVAGDEQQMSPSNYFSGVYTGIDLLHQASYYWNKTALKHHYRSVHPDLISFSNRFFYNNELIAFPSSDSLENPIKLHAISNGIFENRQNLEEAKAVAKLIETNLKNEQSIGIVAFSEQQLECIWKGLSPESQNALTEKIDSGKGFFKALEQVQGDECDKLIISLGYGRNAEGEFHLRFGPLNQKSGSKRLNVLLTRAKHSIDFFASVKASDFSISANESVNLLRLFLMQIETTEEMKAVVFPFGLKPEVNGNQLIFDNISATISDAEELVTMQNVLENRGWNVGYEL